MRIFLPFAFLLLIVPQPFGQGLPANCPAIKIKGPNGVTMRGEPIEFEAETANATISGFHWDVSDGVIERGQGTRSITVDTSGITEVKDVKVTVTLTGLQPGCPNTASESAGVYSIIDWFR